MNMLSLYTDCTLLKAKPLCTCNKKYYALNIHTWEKNNYRGVMSM